MSRKALQKLTSSQWPENVRQLENVLERLLVLSSTNLITDEDLAEDLLPSSSSAATLWRDLPEEGISLEAVERDLISRALERFGGNQTQAARYLDISRRTLIDRMEEHGLASTESAHSDSSTS